ncbi:hypothetical protein [Micromonospora sp. DT62]|uniref:hypothetical protein n=1 Tax=Micromonospora sp. DT62 TaxID=3416521 RepID=UPI003CF05355
MGFSVQVSGGAELYRLRGQLKQLGDTGLGKHMDRAFKAAVKPLGPAIREEAGQALPSGYAPVLSKSLRFRLASKTKRQSTEVSYRVFGDGKRERRDVPSLNRGKLRHPVYGKRRKAWVEQKVRPGFVDRPADRLMPDISREMRSVIKYVSNELKG